MVVSTLGADDKPKVKEADTIKLPAIPGPETHRNWRIKTREAIVAAATNPDATFEWIEVWKEGQNIQALRKVAPFATDAKLLSALTNIITCGGTEMCHAELCDAAQARWLLAAGRRAAWHMQAQHRASRLLEKGEWPDHVPLCLLGIATWLCTLNRCNNGRDVILVTSIIRRLVGDLISLFPADPSVSLIWGF